MSQANSTQALLIGTLAGALVVSIGIALFLYFQSVNADIQAAPPLVKETKIKDVVEPALSETTSKEPPFYGTKYFNLLGGVVNETSITIDEDDTTTIRTYSGAGTDSGGVDSISYMAKFTNPILLPDGTEYLLEDNKVYLLEKGKKQFGCKEIELECASELYD